MAGPAATAIAAAEAQMAALVNRLRKSLGLYALTYYSNIAAVARRWSQTLADEQDLYHNPNYTDQYPAGWNLAGENASRRFRVMSLSDAVQNSFDGPVDSPGHYANMTDPAYTHLGVGIAVEGDSFWATQNFARYPAVPPPSTLPGAASVTATAGENRFSANWSADDNGEPITHWIWEVTGHSSGQTSNTSNSWANVAAGRYTVQVRACNTHGCGGWGTATVTVTGPSSQSPTVRLSKGRNAQGVATGCTSANCHFMRVELVDFDPGTYTVYCLHYGVAGYPPGSWENYTTSDTTSEYCIWGYAGHSTYVIVEDPTNGATWQSNDAEWP